MTDKCNNCSQNIDTSGCTANKYYLVNPTTDSQEAIYCGSCWPQIESEYRLKNYQGNASIHVWENTGTGGKNYMLGYNWNTKQWVEVDLTTRKSDLGSPPNDNNPERERERERAISQLRTRIAELEAIINRTPEQERELQNKKKELSELEKQQQEGGFKKYLTWIIGGGITLILVIFVVYLLSKKSKKSH